MSIVYLDNAATTSCYPEVVSAMTPYWNAQFGNPASQLHPYGWTAEAAVKKSRQVVAEALNTRPQNLVFTSGASESIRLFCFGLIEMLLNTSGEPFNAGGPSKSNAQSFDKPSGAKKIPHVICSPAEHMAVENTLIKLKNLGWIELSFAQLNSDFELDIDSVVSLIRPETKLICALWVNNETGSITSLSTLSELCRDREIFLFSDLTQGIGKLSFSFADLQLSGGAFSAHKFHGPKGIGCLIADSSLLQDMTSWSFGGNQDQNFRSGTQAVPLIVGQSTALQISNLNRVKTWTQVQRLGELLLEGLHERDVHFQVNGRPFDQAQNGLRSAFILNLTFPGKPIALHLAKLGNLAFSSASACTGAKSTVSRVLLAGGLTEKEAQCSMRLSFSSETTLQDIEMATDIAASAFKG